MSTGKMSHWTERRYYSVSHDCEMARISGYDQHTQEHWVELEVLKGYREARNEAIAAVQDSIEAGHPAGKVK